MRLIDADALPKWTGYALSATEVAIAVEHAPTITIKEYAKAEGYSIIKRNPMPKLKPCPRCGVSGRKVEEWVCRTGYFYICSECNHQSKPAMSTRKARENWNATD